jgi:serine protease AprX
MQGSRRRLHFFFLFLVVCLAGLMQATTTISSSRFPDHQTKDGVNEESDQARDAKLFYGDKDHHVSGQDQARRLTIGASFRDYTSPLLRDLNLLIQVSTMKIGPQVLADTADGKSTSVVILLTDQADVSAAYAMTNQDERGWFVYRTLTEHAARTQVDLRSFLTARGIKYQSFWAANMLVATADRPLVEQLAARLDVARVDSNMPARWIEDPIIGNFSLAPSGPKTPNAPNTAEWGVTNVNAPALWALGFTGQGIVVGDLDTGTRWTHNVLKPKYRGWNGVTADHNYNWHDAIHSGGGICGANTVAPCDDDGHGTHTAGTIVGDDGAGNQVGVAPGAKWIGCRNMDQGNGTPATYTECFQFTIAPTDSTGNNPNPALRPHVLNNSWTCPASEGCTTRAELETIVNNTEAAGIFVEASAGNSGPGCSTVSDPPAIYNASFSTGAIDISNTLASFSSRGPSTYFSPGLKPNISAPGVTVRSAYRTSDTTFATLSGTSMAGPHVVGVVALLWSARPSLVRNIAATKTLLQNTANPAVTVSPQTCGGTPSTQIPNNSFGYGRVDALAAYNASSPTAATDTVSGRIVDNNGNPVEGAVINLSGTQTRETITDAQGNYSFDSVEISGFYTVTPARVNYAFSPANRSFSLLGVQTEASFTATANGDRLNAIDTTEFFVRQQYLDFLGREPDPPGFIGWVSTIRNCAAGDPSCDRVHVSEAFFRSAEFQERGYFVYRFYSTALGRKPDYAEFAPDLARVSGFLNDDLLEAAKTQFASDFTTRAAFVNQYGMLNNSQFVDALLQTAGVTLSNRQSIIDGLNAGTLTRAQALRQLAESGEVYQRYYNQAFVVMEYFGYLRRDPDALYTNWILELDRTGSPRRMIEGFVNSTEYRNRFVLPQ